MLGKKKRFRLVLSLLLILTLILPTGSAAVFAAEAEFLAKSNPILKTSQYVQLNIDETEISLSDKKSFTITLTIDPDFFYDKLEPGQNLEYVWLLEWLTELKWEIVRDEADSPYFALGDYYPNVYTGDEISNWRRWSSSGEYFFFHNITSTLFVPADLLDASFILPDVLEAVDADAAEETTGETDEESEYKPSVVKEKDDINSEISIESELIGPEVEDDEEAPRATEEAACDEENLIAGKADDRGGEAIPIIEDDYEYVEPVYEIIVMEKDVPKREESAPDDALLDGEIMATSMRGPVDEPITVVYSFRNNYFYESGNQSRYRNVQGSFIGEYALRVSDADEELAATSVYVNMYDSFRTYMETFEELEEIEAAAAAKGRYMKIDNFGTSEGGFDQHYVIFAKDSASVTNYLALKERAEIEPDRVKEEVEAGLLDYKIPFMINNIHPDENPGVDAQLNFLQKLATEDDIAYSDITGMTAKGKELKEQLEGSFKYITDAITPWATNMGRLGNGVQGAFLVDEMYEVEEYTINVNDLLDNFIFIISPNENPDGRVLNTRRNVNAFDLNRDGAFQTQAETVNMMRLVNKWNPTILIELHGYVPLFLIEPCTPPHEPNLEYDLLIKHFYRGAESFGNSAIGSLSNRYYNEDGTKNTYTKYVIPLRDYFGYVDAENYTGNNTWKAWDDLSTNYTPSYAMLNAGTLGYTIETPYSNEGSTDLFEYGTYGMLQYFMQADVKKEVFINQLNFFDRGLKNVDAKDTIDKYYVDLNDNPLEEDSWRTRYEENDNFFPEYYVIPVDAEFQRDPAAAYEMEAYLLRNGIKLSTLTEDAQFNDVAYKKGSILVSMYQAKRNYANAVLWDGVDASGFAGLYSESVTSFPYLRGFDCDVIVFDPETEEDPFDGKKADLTAARTAVSQLATEAEDAEYVVIMNNGLAAIQVVNYMLDNNMEVSLITGNNDYKGNFLVSSAVWNDIPAKYPLVGAEVTVEPSGAYVIQQPKVFITGRYEPFYDNKITSGYYADWFSGGYGYWDYYNNYSNTTSCFDVMAYANQMGFTIVTDVDEADVIVGSVSAVSGSDGEAVLAAIQSGKPYIAHGYNSLSTVKDSILTSGFDFGATKGAESLHYVAYGSSVVTAARSSMGDNVIYNYGGAYITSVPTGANVLYTVGKTDDTHIAGCFYDVYNTPYRGAVEAFEYIVGDLDVTVFANSIVNKAHQQDDYVYAATAIYSKMMGDDYEKSTDSGGGGSGGRGHGGGIVTDGTGTDSDSGEADTDIANFTDINERDWFYEAVKYAVENGLFAGTSSTQFAPHQQMTRGMFVTVLGRLAEQSGMSTSGYSSSFTDVQVGSYYAKYVSWAASNNIVSGYSATSFAPEDNITREQMAAILVRYAAYAGIELNAGGARAFSDVADISSWALEDVNKAASAGLLSGYEDGTFRPQNTATRAEVATVVKSFKENYVD